MQIYDYFWTFKRGKIRRLYTYCPQKDKRKGLAKVSPYLLVSTIYSDMRYGLWVRHSRQYTQTSHQVQYLHSYIGYRPREIFFEAIPFDYCNR